MDSQGDSFFVAFRTAKDALGAAVDAQRDLATCAWPEGVQCRVRMGLHTGEPKVGDERYVGIGVHRAARIGAAGHGGQVLLSSTTRELAEEDLPAGVAIRDLGERRLKDLEQRQRLYQLVIEGLPSEFKPLRTLDVELKRKRRRMYAGSALVGAAVAAVAIPVLALGHGSSGGNGVEVTPNSVAVIDPATEGVRADAAIAGGPNRLAIGGGRVWVGSDDSRTLSALNPATRQVGKLVAIAGFPTALAAGEGAVWVVDGKSGLLTKVDPAYGTFAGKVRVVAAPNPVYDVSREGFDPISVAAGAGSVWVTDGTQELVRVDPKTTKVVQRINVHSRLDGIAAEAGAVWAVSGVSRTALRLDPRGRVMLRIPIVSRPGFESPYPLEVSMGEGFVWVLNANTATVTKIDPVQRTVSATIPIGIDRGPLRLAVGSGAAWVANRDGTLARIDPSTNAVKTILVGHGLRDVSVAGRSVWVTVGGGLSAATVASTDVGRGRVQPLPTSSCSPIYYGGSGQPRYLIASDLPLQGSGTRIPQLAQAIQYVLKQRAFRAGRYAVGYQSCDDSTAPAGYWSAARCAANAHAYARDQSVIGVIGTSNSPCSQIEVPVLNRAALAMISPSNTYIGLTHSGPGSAPNEPARYYPTGVRNYARVVAADDLQGAADALLARQLGVRRVYVLHDDEPYGAGIAAAFKSAAAKLGIRIVGASGWIQSADRYVKVGRRVAPSRPDGVFLGGLGYPGTNGGALVKDLRSTLPANTKIMAPDGFSLDWLVATIGSAAEGMTASEPSIANDRLPPRGRKFVVAFGKAVGEEPVQSSADAAEAAEILLDAIARSDGTRASVTAELFKTKISNGILGSFAIDPNGDTTAAAVTIYQVVRGKPTVFKVITPPRSVVGAR